MRYFDYEVVARDADNCEGSDLAFMQARCSNSRSDPQLQQLHRIGPGPAARLNNVGVYGFIGIEPFGESPNVVEKQSNVCFD